MCFTAVTVVRVGHAEKTSEADGTQADERAGRVLTRGAVAARVGCRTFVNVLVAV